MALSAGGRAVLDRPPGRHIGPRHIDPPHVDRLVACSAHRVQLQPRNRNVKERLVSKGMDQKKQEKKKPAKTMKEKKAEKKEKKATKAFAPT